MMIGQENKFTNNQINLIRGLIRAEFRILLASYYDEQEAKAVEAAVEEIAPAPEKAVDTAANAVEVEAEKFFDEEIAAKAGPSKEEQALEDQKTDTVE